jgi:hypothetical protein
MTNKLKSILAVAVLVAVFLLGAVLGWHIKPGADKPEAGEQAKMTVNPPAKEVKKADVAIKTTSQGHLSGVKQLPAVAPVNQSRPPDPGRPESAGQIIPAPVEVTVPVSGTITARYTDAKTGATIGEDSRAISGETVVKVEGDRLEVDTKFEDQVTFAVDIPEREPRKNEAGLFAGVAVNGDVYTYFGGYYQRNLVTMQTKKTDIALFARVSVERRWGVDEDWEGRITAGVKVNFQK